MRSIHPKSSELLVLICKRYKQTGETEFSSSDLLINAEDVFLDELEANDYIIRKHDIVDTIVLLDRSINFAKTFK